MKIILKQSAVRFLITKVCLINVLSTNHGVKNKMSASEEYQDNLRADYKVNSYNSNPNSEKQKGKTLGKVVMDENENLHIITKVQKD